MNYRETLDYLYNTLPVFQKVGGVAYKKGLDNTINLLSALDNPHHKFKSIHVAGTNGKGSVSSMLAAVFQNAGYKTGLYTSPHLKEFTERIKVNGIEVDQEFVVDFVEKTQNLIKEIRPSFFELTVAMAFDYFALSQVDIAIIEVGMGGRLDSTNVINPELSIITNISFDHQQYLGDTLEKIAEEKAGIIKENVPVVVSEYVPETRRVFEKAALERNTSIVYASDQYVVSETSLGMKVTRDGKIEYNEIEMDLKGGYQEKNLKAVLAALQVMKSKSWKLPIGKIKEGLKNVGRLTGLKGRWQVLSQSPMIICDTGHNVAGITYILEEIQKSNFQNLYMVLGMVSDKDISGILELLPKHATYIFCQPNIQRALPADDLKQMACQFGLKGIAVPNVNQAIESAKKASSSEDMIFIGGSTFVVAEINNL